MVQVDTSLTSHNAQPFFIPHNPAINSIDFSQPASTWTHPTAQCGPAKPLVGIPCDWYIEDATSLAVLPPNSHGYVDVRNIEQMRKDRLLWLRENAMTRGGS